MTEQGVPQKTMETLKTFLEDYGAQQAKINLEDIVTNQAAFSIIQLITLLDFAISKHGINNEIGQYAVETFLEMDRFNFAQKSLFWKLQMTKNALGVNEFLKSNQKKWGYGKVTEILNCSFFTEDAYAQDLAFIYISSNITTFGNANLEKFIKSAVANGNDRSVEKAFDLFVRYEPTLSNSGKEAFAVAGIKRFNGKEMFLVNYQKAVGRKSVKDREFMTGSGNEL